jgi:hypothetical protein
MRTWAGTRFSLEMLDGNMHRPTCFCSPTYLYIHTPTYYIGLHIEIHTPISAVDAYWKIYLNQKSHIGLSSLYFYLVGKPDHGSTGRNGFSYNSRTHAREHVYLFALLYAQWLQISYPWGNVPQRFLSAVDPNLSKTHDGILIICDHGNGIRNYAWP